MDVSDADVREMWRVLDLIVAEFNSDPMSVQCFDLRTVKAAQQIVERLRDEVRG